MHRASLLPKGETTWSGHRDRGCGIPVRPEEADHLLLQQLQDRFPQFREGAVLHILRPHLDGECEDASEVLGRRVG